MYDLTLRHVHVAIVAVDRQEVVHILSVFVASVIQHAMRMCRVMLSVVCTAVPHFSTLQTA